MRRNSSHGSSPHTRGAPHERRPLALDDGIIPAYAGSTTDKTEALGLSQDHPRIRGEHLRYARAALGEIRIIPAYAGSTSTCAQPRTPRRDHPRIRGEHRDHRCSAAVRRGSSPHTRGARDRFVDVSLKFGIIPAYAGSTGRRCRRTPLPADHPRIRGEHAIERKIMMSAPGSSPHTRGARGRRRVGWSWSGIIPAYAGSTPGAGVGRIPVGDHPRIRGEHRTKVYDSAHHRGSSPHTRGAHGRVVCGGDSAGIIPAYAGSTDCRRRDGFGPGDHPRIRGEHVADCAFAVALAGSSPHTRGAHVCRRRPACTARIIPAYAGSTCEQDVQAIVAADHPRIRGEHRAVM